MDPDADIEARLQALEDRAAIRALILEYRRALDGKDFEAYSKLFGRDGEFIPGSGTVRRGEHEILAMLNGMRGVQLTDAEGDDRHVVVNTVIELDGDRARAYSHWIYLLRTDSGLPHLDQLGHYDDEFVREDGRWRFARREAGRELPASGVRT